MPASRMQVAAPTRCRWCLTGDEHYVRYHDEEWGVPAYDDHTQFEFLILEGAQAGLSWATVLKKRAGYRAAFANFDAERIVRFGKRDVTRLLGDVGIIRNRLKIEAAIGNARAFLELQAQGGFAQHMWNFVDGRAIQNRFRSHRQIPAYTPLSDAISKDLKQRGFSFVGSTIIYAHMQATGMVNDHLVTCFRHEQCRSLSKKSLNRA